MKLMLLIHSYKTTPQLHKAQNYEKNSHALILPKQALPVTKDSSFCYESSREHHETLFELFSATYKFNKKFSL